MPGLPHDCMLRGERTQNRWAPKPPPPFLAVRLACLVTAFLEASVLVVDQVRGPTPPFPGCAPAKQRMHPRPEAPSLLPPLFTFLSKAPLCCAICTSACNGGGV